MAAAQLTKICKVCKLEKSLTLFDRKERGILGVRPQCKECRSAARRARYASDTQHREAILGAQREANAANPEKNRAKVRAWTDANKGRAALYKAAYRATNKQAIVDWQREWCRRNRDKTRRYLARRAAAILRATVSWSDEFIISEIYHLAKLRSDMTGVEWHVDHIVPLRSGTVCGLHCEANLRVITARANKLKSNRWWPDMS